MKSVGDEESSILGALQSLEAARFYIVTRQRNAWHSTTSNDYRGPSSLASSFWDARMAAERWRTQGSQFTIQEIPGLVFGSEAARYALVDFHNSNSFEAWVGKPSTYLKIGTPLQKVIGGFTWWFSLDNWRPFKPASASLVLRELRDDEQPERATPSHVFRAWSSVFYGPDEHIWWREHPGRHQSAGTIRIVRSFQRANRSAQEEP